MNFIRLTASICLCAFLFASTIYAQDCAVFAEENGLLVMETESAPLSDEWSLQTGVEGALGDGYYEWKHGNTAGSIDSPGKGILTYTFQIQTPGTYRFILRTAAPHNTEHNDVWARFQSNEVVGRKSNGSSEVDLGQNSWFKVYQNKSGDEWNWAANTVDHNAHQIFALIPSAGQYVLQLSGRSTLFKVDRIVLFHDSITQNSATNESNPESACTDGEEPTYRPPDTPMNTDAGLQYAYYEGDWDALPDFDTLDPVKTGFVSSVDLSPRDRDDNFAFLFKGYIDVPSDDVYTFYINSDDGSQLYIGDQLVANNDGVHAESEAQGSIGLEAGLHAITVLFFENAGQEVLEASWSSSSQAKETIGASAFVYDTDDLLPVELTSFTGVMTESSVVLSWDTASELNNAGFYVERSSDVSSTYEAIGFVEGVGSSTVQQRYSYQDISLPSVAKTLYYRLKQVDFDGAFAYSPVVSIEVPLAARAALHPNYPNPFNPSTLISFSLPEGGAVRLSVYDMEGRLIEVLFDEDREAGYHEIIYAAPTSLSSGTYMYQLETPTSVHSGTMVLLK